jgi:hypothetical protein
MLRRSYLHLVTPPTPEKWPVVDPLGGLLPIVGTRDILGQCLL